MSRPTYIRFSNTGGRELIVRQCAVVGIQLSADGKDGWVYISQGNLNECVRISPETYAELRDYMPYCKKPEIKPPKPKQCKTCKRPFDQIQT